MAYASWSVVAGEQPSAAKWNILGTNDAFFEDFIIGTNSVHAAWATWSPTLSNITAGNGTTLAKYVKYGTTVFYHFKFTLGSSSAMGSAPAFTLPTTPSANYANGADGAAIGQAWCVDTATNQYGAVGKLTAAATITCQAWSAASSILVTTTIGSTVPMTWTTGDSLSCYGTYESTS